MTRVFHRRPTVVTHHQRSVWLSATTASIGQPSAGMKGLCSAKGSMTERSRRAVWTGDHHRMVLPAKLPAALGKSTLHIPLGYDQLYQRFNPDSQDQQVVHDLPAEQDKFGAEAWSHGDHQSG